MFSSEEIQHAISADFFNIKRAITDKVYSNFAELGTMAKEKLESDFKIESTIINRSKIYRGENLEGLPWINCDAPGWFNKEETFAIRFLFWWANHYSVTLHLSGKFLNMLDYDKMQSSKSENVLLCINEKPWRYDLHKDNYIPLAEIKDVKPRCRKMNFIKLSIAYPIATLHDFNSQNKKALMCLIGLLRQN
ncbi:MAG TPA: hypothetical protein PLU85_09100 [Bacteroidia bacterium]|nr:hypothetical protein [Bacteroidia bacterium]HOZ89299.1 hypothetical protein [Bacteroidia bacterium]HQW17552.1 hypothetical protein [Bacteroidia bacterium]HQW48968.1 hypothetical protein [Bacteroidia bacterium]HQX69123.1 hypothetical protein [Bacteroidia bacterium]